ncbi:universal stress protein [Listeria costaricensis]|uniref:universal stress protein n=1 Tax=Listeria costaricensis TaxID=2026604 RepID=UPI001F08ACD4|nr:universal stress protein [Listeria costaricensis]
MMEEEYGRILVAVDGSDSGDAAFQKAIGTALRNQAELGIIHVIDTLYFANFTALDGGQTVNEFSATAEKMLDEYKEKATRQGVKVVHTFVEFGSPKATILKVAEEKYPADLIVLGAVGHSAITRMLLGSVSSYVALYAPCDVLIEREAMK